MLTIRPACPDDETFLMGLTPRLADFALPPWRTADEIAQADRQNLRDALRGLLPDAAILVAEASPGGERTGYVFATTRHDHFTHAAHAHVEVLAVEANAQGRGVGPALMDAIEQWAKGRGHAWVTLNVFHGNTRARALYDRLGYEAETIHYRKTL
jgi:ribosomal protein S18 acetylase RimI-like enzyme